jgi:3-oxoacyl-[acyl-carrier protein] reductase
MLNGLRAIVTGAASGIGHAIAEALAAAGARVLAADRKPPPEWSPFSPGSAIYSLTADLVESFQPARIVEEAVRQLGGVDIVVNNAAILRLALIDNVDAAAIGEAFTVNVAAPLLLVAAAAAKLKESKCGRVINIGSVNSQFATRAGGAVYTATKHAVAGLTKAMAVEFGPYGVTANYIMPGPVLTPMSEGFGREWREAYESKIPLGRLVTPTDIATAALFLASPAAAMINGHGLAVDGGMIARL